MFPRSGARLPGQFALSKIGDRETCSLSRLLLDRDGRRGDGLTGREFCGEVEGGEEAVGAGEALAGDVERGAVIG